MEKYKSEDLFDGVDVDDDGYDAVVIGSGYGGSVAAYRMSVAGFKVCLIEKGRQWEAGDFPTDSFKIWSAARIEIKNMGVNLGPKDALFQIHLQDDSLAVVACGLGGGSLINAGVMLPTPVRARRDPKWPKSWEKDWEICEASALEMLRVQSIPMKFQNSKIMEQVIEEGFDKSSHNSLTLGMNFEIEEKLYDPKRSQETGSCLACGNCLSGCPYNAKNSTDKTYLALAVEAGCKVKTKCEVQYVVRNQEDNSKDEGKIKRRRHRWLVFLNEFDYVAADFVVLSAGVFGTAKILFQSQMRGLPVSRKLGSGLSCNGNNVAYLAGSSAPLNAYGLSKKQLSKIPFQERPGPSISSSYTSSLGFTIQSAVTPTSYPCLLFKGITTYGWQSGYWFLRDIIDKLLKHVMGMKQSQAMVLNAIGYDGSNGKLTFDKATNKILFQPPHDSLLPRKIEAFKKLANKLGGNLFMSRFRSTSAHHLGGCIASPDVSCGVCNSSGQVFDVTSLTGVHQGLYVCDASIIPCSVGINPSLTIATAAEHVSRHLVQDAVKYNIKLVNENCVMEQDMIINNKMSKSQNQEVTIRETMRGIVGGMLCTASLKLKFETSGDLEKTSMVMGKSYPLLRGKVGGYIVCKALEMEELYVIKGKVDLCHRDIKTPYTVYMHYHLLLAASSGSRYVLEGKKIMNPYFLALYAWKESTTLHVTLRKITKDFPGEQMVNLKGQLKISLIELLKSLWSLEGGSRSKFICLLLQSLLRTYILQVPQESHISFGPLKLAQISYPNNTIHKIKTEDDFNICCIQWECSPPVSEPEKRPYPVLLINGYSTESYCLPTEPNDVVRTLLQEGHDVWLLQGRLHVPNSQNDFSIEDIGKIDIPAAISMISKLYGESIKVHVVAHCVGGLAIHIALMGGHVSAKKIASLCCTNSSMFFKLTKSSSVKMWLPLVPMSMAILGKNNTLPLLQTSTASLRHWLLKSISRLMPRYERCTCDKCEVFSGIFGNTFWHENISHTMHCWMNKEYLQRLPMAAFPHLRKICNAGFIVDSKGKNAYLIHPERMPLPTLYISGGRTLLVTPETSFLANNYMKLHQPGYRHERVVVEGFGHSDLLIGEESNVKVFPHIVKHMGLAEKERDSSVNLKENKYKKDPLEWSNDPYKDTECFGSWSFLLITIMLFVVLFKVVFSQWFSRFV